MKITDLLKKLSLVAAVSAFALPSYASDHEGGVDEALEEAKVHATAASGPLTFTIVDHESGKKKIMTMTNCKVMQVVVDEEGSLGKQSYLLMGDESQLMASSNGRFNLGGTTFDLSEAMGEEGDLADCVAKIVAPFLEGVVASEDEALALAKEKALAKKAKAEEEALAQKLAEVEALAEEEAHLKEEALAKEAEEVKVETEEVKVEAESEEVKVDAEEVKVDAEEVKAVKEGDEL